MIVCQCRGITDRQIRKAVREGARSRSEVGLACTAGSSCGGCSPTIDRIIEAEGDLMIVPALSTLRDTATS